VLPSGLLDTLSSPDDGEGVYAGREGKINKRTLVTVERYGVFDDERRETVL
jgi:hypothetical protein